MPVFANDPVRVQMTWNDLLNKVYKSPKGLDVTFIKDKCYDDIWLCQFVASDIFPYDQDQEKYKEDIERELNILKVVQDNIREFEPHTHFPKKKRTVETILDEKVFEKDNRYDVILDKVRDKHLLSNGKWFGTIEDA